MNILMVSPRTPDTFWSFNHVMPFISRRTAFPPLGLLTVAGMLPRDWGLRLVDLNVRSLRDADIAWADYVFISGMIVHAESAHRVIARCIALGKPIIAGGPLFSTGRERFPELQHVVINEAEDVMPALVEDLRAGTLKPSYQSAVRPDVTRTPIPRWDLLRLKDYATMSVQFSRGCPFNCEFCDIIVMNGRVPRTKAPAQMIAEMESLLAAGWDGPIFIVDDNFIGNRVKVTELLREMVAWRRRRNLRTVFTTEASLNVVDHPELLELMVAAGFKKLFVGIESPVEESLLECAKVQNTRRNMLESIRTIQQAGMEVMGGFILGFDHDRESIFEAQRRFIQESGVVTAMVGLLTALPGTRLFSRLKEEGRLLGHSTGNNTDGVLNFIPKLDHATLVEGYRSLVKSLYTPREYYRRIITFLEQYRPSGPRAPVAAHEIAAFLRSLWVMGVWTRGRREYWKFLTRTLLSYRHAFSEAIGLAITGHHFRRVAATL